MLPSPSWWAWLGFVKTIDALPLDARELQLYRQCTGRTAPPSERARRIVAIVGRRAGKTRIIAWLASFIAAFIDHSAKLSPGETGLIAIMAPSKAQAGVCFGYI